IGGGEAAAQIARIDDIVMQQSRGMDELDGGRQGDVTLAGAVTAEAGRRQGQHRAKPLAAGGDDVAGELRDERDGALHALEDEGIDAGKVGAQQLAEPVEAGGRLSRILLDGGNKRQLTTPVLVAAVAAPIRAGRPPIALSWPTT